jgi:hypothetical protein
MKRALLHLLDAALQPFGLRAVTQSHLNQVGCINERNRSLADLYRRVCLQPTDISAEEYYDMLRPRNPKPTTLPPRRRRRGRIPTSMLLTNKQRRLVKENILNTAQLAKALGVSWPTADKLRRDMCPFYDQTKTKTYNRLAA